MRIIPAVDVWEGKVVRLSKGDFATAQIYGDDPVAMARHWQNEGAEIVHVVDLAGARHGTFDEGLWQLLGSEGIAFQAGGGMRTVASVRRTLELGALRVVLGSVAVWDEQTMGAVLGEVGPDRLVGAIDVRAEKAVGSGWEDGGRPAFEVLGEMAHVGVQRVLVTAIARDGLMQGPDLDLLGEVRNRFPTLSLIASGGVSTPADLFRLADLCIDEVVVGRALYEHRLTLAWDN